LDLAKWTMLSDALRTKPSREENTELTDPLRTTACNAASPLSGEFARRSEAKCSHSLLFRMAVFVFCISKLFKSTGTA
jgi:hypothetical protein